VERLRAQVEAARGLEPGVLETTAPVSEPSDGVADIGQARKKRRRARRQPKPKGRAVSADRRAVPEYELQHDDGSREYVRDRSVGPNDITPQVPWTP
jgi:hypothetical protein